MNKIIKSKIDVRQAITKNGKVDIDGAMSVLLHNAGTVTATINGNLTVKAGATLQLAAPQANVVIHDHITVHFEASTGARLEIVSIRIAEEAYSNFS